MSTLTDLASAHARLSTAQVEHLHRLVADWQLISDLSFADLLLWAPTGPGIFLCVAQVRPTTAPTTHAQDQVGRWATVAELPHLGIALDEGRIWREGDPVWQGDVPVRHEAVPVRHDGDVIAVVGRDTNLASARVPSQLELVYLETAGDLCQMVALGSFPLRLAGQGAENGMIGGPRVGDGLLRLAADGQVGYASPNAQSAYRRLGIVGDVLGVRLSEVVRGLVDDPLSGAEAAGVITSALAGEAPPRVELDARGATVLLRALPLLPEGAPAGALVLVRDDTEVRRRDRQLLSKDALIREIHHRVKNNLQTVAALLRLQARRVDSEQAKAALAESVRRVMSIAMVHDTLSVSTDESVEFDSIVDRVVSMVGDVAAPETRVRVRREGSFGVIAAEVATPLVTVLTELLQNAVEHGYPRGRSGDVVVSARLADDRLQVEVRDDGVGLPSGFRLEDSRRLGLVIVRSLVQSELGGVITVQDAEPSGTVVEMSLPAAAD
ncbi:MAG: histidine kinase N-terminal domain-containing protein [Mycobacteriales bacterium]